MSEQAGRAIISCPSCLRQYEAPLSAKGKIGRCARCDAHFAIAIAEWRLPDGEPVVFTDPVAPRYAFFEDGCATFARNAIDLLKLAGAPATIAGIKEIVATIPRCPSDVKDDKWRERFCSRMMEAAYCSTSGAERERVSELIMYFAGYIPSRPWDALDMLTAAFLGVLRHDDLEPPRAAPLERGGLAQWFTKMVGRN